MASHQFNDQRMKAMLPKEVWTRFRDARAAGEDVTKDDMDAISVRFLLTLTIAATLGCRDRRRRRHRVTDKS